MLRRITSMIALCLALQVATSQERDQWRTIPDNEYDWKKEMRPEQPYMNEYHQTQVMKLLMSYPDGKGGSVVIYTFEEVLSILKKMDVISRGAPKIIFLAGWQYNGHDDKYPAWHEVNDALKRSCDASGLESFLWLAEEAKKYNTAISVHVNITDAYKESPLWDEYFSKGLISRNIDGTPLEIGLWNNQRAYQICYTNEWESGYIIKRIDELLELLPFITDSGSIMLDACFARENPYEKIPVEQEVAYQRRIFRYLRERGIDATNESFNRLREGQDHFVGISPWFCWMDQTQANCMDIPAYIATGGASHIYLPQFPKQAGEELKLGFLFGMSGRGDDCLNDLSDQFKAIKNWASKYRYQFYTGTFPYVYLNRYKREKIENSGDQRVVYYNDGLKVSLQDSTINHNGRILRSGDDIFMPVLWQAKREYMAYSRKGYTDKRWQLPADWSDVVSVDIYRISPIGTNLRYMETIKVENGYIRLSLKPEDAYSIRPSVGRR